MSVLTTPTTTVENRYQALLERRMAGPQRHRLLQGYPMPPLMVEYDRGRPFEPIQMDDSRPLIVGVLPHASCNPSVKGCGYCTFPHEEFQATSVRETVRAVVREISKTNLGHRQVDALYLGGGTANLTPPDVFRELCRTLEQAFRLDESEVTLEGAPVFFTARKEALLQILESELSCRDRRLSMGVQTFDEDLLAHMGRTAIGGAESVRNAVKAAQRRGMTTSADLMINMPWQSLEQMKQDVRTASEMGFSQLCVYHLVLFRGLGTPWSKNRDMLDSLPDNQRAFENWLEVTELVKSLGYRQTTLTNFEREGNYRYEHCSYTPEKYDGVGFGPEAISCFVERQNKGAVKWMNKSASVDYRAGIEKSGDARARLFVYGEEDRKLLFLTRSLPRMRVSRDTYKRVFRSDLLDDYIEPLEALQTERLVEWDRQELRLTPKGMFYADSVAGLLAHDRVGELRRGIRADMNDAPVFRMG